MRVLWFAGGASNYSVQQNCMNMRFNASGWVSQLRSEMMKRNDIKLGICFDGGSTEEQFTEYDIEYYTFVRHTRNRKDKLHNFFHPYDEKYDSRHWPHYIKRFKQVINAFKPDVIEVFGSEVYLQLSAIAAKEENVPCVLHIQGILAGCIHAVLPPQVSKWSYIFSAESLKGAYSNFQVLNTWRKDCYREKVILSSVPYVIGRTNWDLQMARIFAPQAKYFYGGEMLKPAYYEPSERIIPKRATIASTISIPLYKGFDMILRIANILKNELHIDFVWNVYGNVNPKLAEKITELRHQNLGIILKGVTSAPNIKSDLLNTSVYVHPSYIDNSPNSLCEAQILGVPAVASNVGGVSSLVQEGETGFLYPVMDPYTAAYHIHKLIVDKKMNERIGNAAKAEAIKRHNVQYIADQLVSTYKEMLNHE